MNNEVLKFSVDKIELLKEVNKSHFAKVKLYAFASGNNAHEKPVSEETLKLCAETIYWKPLVWYYDKWDDDAGGHDPLEVPCGFVHDKDNPINYVTLDDGRLMLTVEAMVWKRYSGKLLSLFQRDNLEKPVSVEMQVIETKELGVNSEELLSYCFAAITILGTNVRPAVKDAKAEILEFTNHQKEFKLQFGKYDSLNFEIPESVKNNAQKGLELRKEFNRGGTSVGLSTAKYLINNNISSPEKVRHISKYFPRHAGDNLDQKDPPSNGYIAWLLWGGDSGRSWSTKLINAMNKIDEKSFQDFEDEDVDFTDTSSIKIDNFQEQKKEENRMNFSKTPERFAKVKEFCGNMKYQSNEQEMCKYEAVDYSENYIYAIDNETKKMAAIPYSVKEDGNFEANFQGIKKVKVKFEESEEDMDTYAIEKMAKAMFATDANLEPAANVARSKQETEGDKKAVEEDKKNEGKEEMSAKLAEMEAKFSELSNENKELKEFKTNVIKQQEESKIEFAISEVTEDMPKEKIDEWRDQVIKFASVDAWANALKADAYNYVKGSPEKESFSRMGLPFDTNKTNEQKGLWED